MRGARRGGLSAARAVQQARQQTARAAVPSGGRAILCSTSSSSLFRQQRDSLRRSLSAASSGGFGDVSLPADDPQQGFASTPGEAKASEKSSYVSLRDSKPFVIMGLGNFYHFSCRHSAALRVVDLLVTEHLGWKWQWKYKYRGWVSEGSIVVPSLEPGGKETTKHVVFVKPGTYNIRSNGVSARRVCMAYQIQPENCLMVHFDATLPVGTYGPAHKVALPSGEDQEVKSYAFLTHLKKCMRIQDHEVAGRLRRFAIGVDAPDHLNDKIAVNFGPMKNLSTSVLDEAYLNSRFTPAQDEILRRDVLGNADHMLRSMLGMLGEKASAADTFDFGDEETEDWFADL